MVISQALGALEIMLEAIIDRREALLRTHQATFGSKSLEVRYVLAPYRVCPLGAHVDHQLGMVTGLTIDSGILLAFTPADRDQVRLTSRNFPGMVEFNLGNVPPASSGDWGNYARGAALALRDSHSIQRGMDGVIEGNLPVGGLSSSAAAGVAYLMALEAVNGLHLSRAENIRLDQVIENSYIGLNNGILDQSVILLAQQQCLLLLDCQSGDHESIPLPPSAPSPDVTVVYSGLDRSLLSTDYNRRVSECQEAARMLLQYAGVQVPERPHLRQLSKEVFDAYAHRLPEVPRRRARHFFEENARVVEGAEAWRTGDLALFGELMNASGESSIHNYESGAPHLITLYRMLSSMPGVYGARFSGAGFRGSAAALTHPDAREEIRRRVQTDYPKAHPDVAERFSIHFCRPASGAVLQ